MKNKTIHMLTACALMAALLCVLGPLAVPIGPIPITLATLILYLTVYLLGTKGAFLTVLVYLLLGAAGMPVFSGYAGGLAKLVGPTGGYLAGYLLLVPVSGFLTERGDRKLIPTIFGMIAGTAVLYLVGTVWFVAMMKCETAYALSVCVVPFIPFDLGKIVLATLFGKLVRTPLVKQNLLPK